MHTVFADDVLIATEYEDGATAGNPVALTGADYYIDGGSIRMHDVGRDVYEDVSCAPTTDDVLEANIGKLSDEEQVKYTGGTVDRD